MAVVIQNMGALNAYRWEMALRGILVHVHVAAVKTAERAQKEVAPTLTGALKKSITTRAIIPAGAAGAGAEAIVSLGRSDLTTAVITTKPDAHFSWVETPDPILPHKSVLVFPILPGWRPKRTKPLSEKEQREQKVIVTKVRGRRYNRWRERGVRLAANRLNAVLGRLRLRLVLEV